MWLIQRKHLRLVGLYIIWWYYNISNNIFKLHQVLVVDIRVTGGTYGTALFTNNTGV
jgi:hypothetical protein